MPRSSIPDEVIEAAECDGITGWSQFWKIKLPLILPAIGIISILTFVGNFNAFDLVYTDAGRAGRTGLFDRYPGHVPLSHLLRFPAAAG
jgi:raffinose/stachyose/melibiose transport system permease protein